ncbi:hypothetical protein Trydic_g20510 [Trypoxylus dichotomus]
MGKLRKIQFNPSDILVSFDVVLLRYIADLFSPDITQLFKHCLTTSYFVCGFYEQMGGVAIGCSLNPVVANLFMDRFESLAIETAMDKPRVWCRYVADTFVVWPHG